MTKFFCKMITILALTGLVACGGHETNLGVDTTDNGNGPSDPSVLPPLNPTSFPPLQVGTGHAQLTNHGNSFPALTIATSEYHRQYAAKMVPDWDQLNQGEQQNYLDAIGRAWEKYFGQSKPTDLKTDEATIRLFLAFVTEADFRSAALLGFFVGPTNQEVYSIYSDLNDDQHISANEIQKLSDAINLLQKETWDISSRIELAAEAYGFGIEPAYGLASDPTRSADIDKFDEISQPWVKKVMDKMESRLSGVSNEDLTLVEAYVNTLASSISFKYTDPSTKTLQFFGFMSFDNLSDATNCDQTSGDHAYDRCLSQGYYGATTLKDVSDNSFQEATFGKKLN